MCVQWHPRSYNNLEKITCGALKPPSAPAGLFVLLGLTALVQPSRGGSADNANN